MLAPLATNLMAGGIDFFKRRLVFDREGTPRWEVREITYSHRQQSRQVTWYDLENHLVGTYPDSQAPRLGFGVLLDLDAVLWSGWRGGRRNDLTGWRFLPPPGAEVPIWHKLPSRGLMVGYLYPYGRLIGYLGPEGVVESGQPGPRFVNPRFIASPPHLGQVWVDQGTIYSIDLDRMTVRRLWTSPSGPIRALGYIGHRAVVLCGNTLRVMDFDGVNVRTLLEGPLPEGLREHVAWQISWVKDRLVISNFGEHRVRIYQLGPDGRELNAWDTGVPPTSSLGRVRKVALTISAAITTPWAGVTLQWFLKRRFPEAYRLVEPWVTWPYRPSFLAISLTLTIVSVILTWWHLRLRGTGFQMGLGLVITLLLSWPGHLVCRTLFDLSCRLPCPACGRLRAVNRANCPRCRARWPAPPRTGYEILLPV